MIYFRGVFFLSLATKLSSSQMSKLVVSSRKSKKFSVTAITGGGDWRSAVNSCWDDLFRRNLGLSGAAPFPTEPLRRPMEPLRPGLEVLGNDMDWLGGGGT